MSIAGAYALAGVSLVLFFFIFFKLIRIVPEQEAWVVEEFGKFNNEKCKFCVNGAFPDTSLATAPPNRMTAACTRACIACLEDGGKIETNYKSKFRRREPWGFELAEDGPEAKADTDGREGRSQPARVGPLGRLDGAVFSPIGTVLRPVGALFRKVSRVVLRLRHRR